MGIPKFAAALRRLFPTAFQKIPPGDVTSLSIDFNAVLHTVAQKFYGYGGQADPVRQKLLRSQDSNIVKAQFFIAVGQEIVNLCRRIYPKSVLIVAVDGVAPWAKINQQRNRRFKSGMSRVQGQFDSNAFTPGTDIMNELDKYLQAFFQNPDTLANLPSKIIYSPHTVPGEGEHKILDYFRDRQVPNTGNHVFHGMDADLILLALNMPQDQIFLWREDPGRGVDIINIDVLRNGILGRMNTTSALEDFTFTAMFVGNDFLPRYPLITNLDSYFAFVFDIYPKLTTPMIDDTNKIVWTNAAKFINELSIIEPELVNNLLSGRLLKPFTPLMEAMDQFDQSYDREQFHYNWYKFAFNPLNDPLVNRIVDETMSSNSRHMIISYLQGIQWIITYYRVGMRYIDQEYFYPYYFAPLAGEMSMVLQDVDVGILDLAPVSLNIGPLEQLLSVLPPASMNLLPRSAQYAMSINSPIYDLYPEKFVIDLTGKEAEWEGVALLPWTDITRIQNFVKDHVTPTIRNRFSRGKDLKIDNEMSTLQVPRRLYTSGVSSRGRGSRAPTRGRGSSDRGTTRGRGQAPPRNSNWGTNLM